MKDKIFGVLQRVGRSFMLPIAILPVAGLLLGIGSSFTNETTIATYGLQKILGSGTLLNSLLIIMNKVGSAVFDNLPLIFAVGVAIGMAKKEKEVAALSALIAYFVMNVAVSAMLLINNEITADGQRAADVLEGTITSVCGIQSLQMGVFGGIIVGLGVAALHNRFHKIVLPNALSFFGGSRFIPIISTIVYMFVGILMYFVWPAVQNGIYALGGLVTGSGYLGTLIFGIIKRALIPFGLHHVFYMPFWQTAVGGTMEVAGQVVQGGQNIFFAQLADSANIAHFSADATRYFSGEFIFMIFGLPGAALAMYRCAKPEKKKAAGGLLLSAALACMFTGITEPLEFSFLFVAPALFVVQVTLAGAAYMIAHMLNIAVGLTFSGGFLDLFLFGILQGNAKTSWLRIIPVGIIYFILYYVIFTFMIRKFNFKTPGREDDDTETKLYTKADVNARKEAGKTAGAAAATSGDPVSELITRGLGGKKKKRWLKILIALVVVAAIVVGCVSSLTKNVNNQLSSSYLVATATRQDLTVSVSGTATLQPADSYNVTTLLSGDIVSAPFEEGDLVTKDTLLYTMDSSDAQDSVDRAQISVEQAQMTYQQAQEALHPTAPISGTVSEVYVHNGESVNAGSQLARIVASTELSIDFLFPYASPSDFYVGQTATVFIDGYAGTQTGTVTNVSNSTTITSNGMQAISVRVRLNNPGAVSDAGTASAVIGSYSSYGQSPVSMPASSIVYATGSGTVNDFTKLVGSTVTKG